MSVPGWFSMDEPPLGRIVEYLHEREDGTRAVHPLPVYQYADLPPIRFDAPMEDMPDTLSLTTKTAKCLGWRPV